MDKAVGSESHEPRDDQNVFDVTVCLRNNEGTLKFFRFESSLLSAKSKFFADKLLLPSSPSCIEIDCSVVDSRHYIDLLNLLQSPVESLVDSWRSINSALGILQAAVSLQCEEIAQSCVNYLEAVPWEDKEEEEILRIVPKLGHVAMPILARLKPVDPGSTKNVFLAAVRYAMSISSPCPPFGDEIITSAQEQIEYMLGEDEETPLVTADEEVKSEVRVGVSQMFSSFERELATLFSLSDSDLASDTSEDSVLCSLIRLEWLCNILPKMNFMRDFVSKWVEISSNITSMVDDRKFETIIWRLKFKVIEITSKVLEAVGYGSVILPPACRVQLLKTWLPFIQKMKPVLDTIGDDETGFPHKMDDELCQSIQGAMVSLIVAMPSSDQASILADWMESEHLGFPDLTEAFEIWCYRTKSSKRRLVEGLDRVSSSSVTSDSSV